MGNADCKRMELRAERLTLNFSEISELPAFTLGAVLYAPCGYSIAKLVTRNRYRRTADFLNPSSSTVKTDGYVFSFDNDRNFAGSLGVFQHGVKMPGLFDHVIIIYPAAFFGKSFTSCPGVRSSIFSEKQNFVRHFFSLIGRWLLSIP